MKKIRTYITVAGFALVLLMPYLLRGTSSRFRLNGVTEETGEPEITAKGLWEGTSQKTLGDSFAARQPGRDLMIRLRNQFLFSLYGISPNTNLVVGRNGDIFEKEYVMKYEKIYPPAEAEFVKDVCDKLKVIRDSLARSGKEMYLFITPTKVRYYEEDVPEIYRISASFADWPGNYEILKETLKNYDFKVFDSIEYIEAHRDEMDYPLYYKTGSHWSGMLAAEVTTALNRFLNENSRFRFREASMDYAPVPEPIHPDADVFNSMNLLEDPYDEYYDAVYVPEGPADTEKRPELFCRGGSFMGQSLMRMINAGDFSHSTYIENTIWIRDAGENGTFSDYGELPLKDWLDSADMLIFEVNESHVPVMSFGLIDYLAEHPELFPETAMEE